MSKISDNEATILLLQQRLNQRGANIEVDGHGGSETRTALNLYFPSLQTIPAATPVAVAANDPASDKHYAIAKEYLGLRELPGAATHPDLVWMFQLAPSWLDQDDSKTAWCGILRGGVGFKAGTGMPKDHYRAAEWAKWGKAVDVTKPATWKKGDTIVMTRPGGNHVCLLDRVEGAKVWCLGGNQSNAVTIASFPISRITAVRR